MIGQFGSKISDALSTEFFQWFHLEKTGESIEGGVYHLKYQPTSPQFHDLVCVTMTADSRGALRGMRMSVRRSFVDDPQHFTMAADISKSFLLAALETDDASIMRKSMTQIRQYTPASSEMVARPISSTQKGKDQRSQDDIFESIKNAIDAGQPVYTRMKDFARAGNRMVPVGQTSQAALLPGEGEPAYLAYSGKRRQLEIRLTHSLLQLVNGNDAGFEQLQISVTPI